MTDTYKKKILIIPSWYPILRKRKGEFFREQAELMIDIYNIKVLCGFKKTLSRKRFFFNKLTFKKFDHYKYFEEIIEPPEAIGFSFKRVKGFSDEKNFNLMISAYIDILKDVIKNGWKPDLIHAQTTVNGGIIANYLSQYFNIPYFITEHQVFLLHNYPEFQKKLIIKSLEEANKVAVVSYDKMKFILMHNINCKPVVVGNLVDDELFNIEDTTSKRSTFNILTVTSASFLKDLYTFFNAIKLLVDKGHTDIVVNIVGLGLWGEKRQEYKSYAKDLGIENYCNYHDIVEREHMPEFYNSCDVFVLTSIAEGLPVSILEAMACGKFVISTANGGAEDIIEPDNGVIVKIKDYCAVADAIIGIKTYRIKCQPEKIRKIVQNKYGKKTFRKRIANLYDEAISVH